MDNTSGYAVSGDYTAPFITGAGEGMIRVGGGFRDSPGSTLPGGVREPVPTDDDLRLNTDFSNLDGFVGLRYLTDAGPWTGLSVASHRAERGIAAELGSSNPRLWRYPHVSRTIVALSGGTGVQDTRWGSGDLEASIGLDVGRTEIESYTDRSYDLIDGVEEGTDRTLTLRLLGDHTLGPSAELRSSVTVADINHDETLDGVTDEYQQRLMSLGAESIVRLVDDPDGELVGLRLSVGAAYDRGTTPKTGGRDPLGTIHDWGARLGLSALVNEGSTMFHVGLSRRGRFPSLRETYSEALNRFLPNPDLTSEHLLAMEGGVTSRMGNGEVQIVGFHHRLSDAIRRITLEGGLRQRINSDRITSTGVELVASQTFGSFTVSGDIRLQAVDLVDPGTETSTQPENLPERAAHLNVIVPVAGMKATAGASYTGSQFCQDLDTGADVELDGGTWLTAGLSRVFGLESGDRSVEAGVSLDNVANSALYDQCGLPRPGRSVRIQMRLF